MGALGTLVGIAGKLASFAAGEKRGKGSSSKRSGGSKGSGVGGATLTPYQNSTGSSSGNGGSSSGGGGSSSGSGGSSSGDGYTPRTFTNSTNAANPNDYITLDPRDGSLWHYVGGKGYQVMKNDSQGRYDPLMQSYLEQNGGYADTSTQNNPMGFDRAASYLQDNAEMSQRAIQQGIDAAINRLNGSRDDVNAQYDSANRGAYVNYMQGQKNMAQNLKNAGLTKTGASESTMLGANTDYANLVNSNESAREKALRDIAYQIADVEANGAKALAESAGSVNSQLANLYTQQLAAQVAQRNADRAYQQQAWQNRMDNTMSIVNLLMGMGATGRTIYNNANGTIPWLNTDDFNSYGLNRTYNMEQINQALKVLLGQA